MFKLFWFKKDKNHKEKKFITPAYIVMNVDNFNAWFNHPDNNATYAHPGIFLRLDKLSANHVTEYLEKCYDLKKEDLISPEYDTHIFMEKIIKDWLQKLHK